jgi:hypothetical protein
VRRSLTYSLQINWCTKTSALLLVLLLLFFRAVCGGLDVLQQRLTRQQQGGVKAAELVTGFWLDCSQQPLAAVVDHH